jgi:endonuclease YncB( thermonuclease family)
MRSALFILLCLIHPALYAATLPGRTIRIIDGDTIVVLGPGNAQYKIRLQGIDAPERGQAYGTKSKEHLSELVAGRFVVVEYEKRDRYGRIVGKVVVGKEDAGLEQIKVGLAWHYKKYQDEQTETDRQLYSEAETAARIKKFGLWQDPHAVPPWEYRAGKRN